MEIDAKAPRKAGVDDRVAKLTLTASDLADEHLLARLFMHLSTPLDSMNLRRDLIAMLDAAEPTRPRA